VKPSHKPSGYAKDDDFDCDGCRRYLEIGEPYWGGGLDYWGEAVEAYCEACEVKGEQAAQAMCGAYEAEMKQN